MKKKILAALLLSLVLTGCGSTPEVTIPAVPSSPIIVESSSAVKESSEASSEIASSESSQPESASPEPDTGSVKPILSGALKNNNGFFVQKGDIVYFRVPTRDAMLTPEVSSAYMTFVPGSILCSYNLKTGAIEELSEDNSCGPLVLSGEELYSHASMSDETRTYEYLETMNLRTGEVSPVEGSDLLGASENGTYVAVGNWVDSFPPIHSLWIYQDGMKIADLGAFQSFVGFFRDKAVYIANESDGFNETYYLRSYDVKTGANVNLGFISNLEDFYPGVIDQTYVDGNRIYICFGIYEGTGHFYAGAKLVEADLNTPGSISVSDMPSSEDFPEWPEHSPFFIVENGFLRLVDGVPGTTALDTTGMLGYYDENAQFVPVASGYDSTIALNENHFTRMEIAEYIDGKLFVVTNEEIRDPAHDIGWRYAYYRKTTDITVIDCNTLESTTLAHVVSE